jgi:hypothetical protein
LAHVRQLLFVLVCKPANRVILPRQQAGIFPKRFWREPFALPGSSFAGIMMIRFATNVYDG